MICITTIFPNFHCKIRELVLLDNVKYADQEIHSGGSAHLVSDNFMISVLSVNLTRSQFSSSASPMVGKASKSTLSAFLPLHSAFSTRSQNCETRLLASCLSVLPPACPHGTTRLPGRIFIKFDICDFYGKKAGFITIR